MIITTLGTPITQNFDTLAQTGTSNPWADDTTLPGWYSQFVATPANPTVYRGETGSGNAGAIYSFGVAGVNPITDRAFGSISSGTPGTIYNAFKLTNASGSAISSLEVRYTGEQWRDGGNATPVAQSITFQYQTASPGTITDANTPSAGWTTFAPLNFTSPVFTATAGALDGNAAANRTAIVATVVFQPPIADGQEIWIRWEDINDTGNDHGLAIDDFSVIPRGATAAEVSVSGRVSTSDGRGITNAYVTISGGSLPEPRYVTTGRRGAYIFEGLQAGDTYIISVGTRRFTFTEPNRVMTLNDNVENLDFVAEQ